MVSLLIVSGGTANHLLSISQFTDASLRERLSTKSNETLNLVEGTLDGWYSLAAVAAHSIDASNRTPGATQKILASNRELLAIAAYDAEVKASARQLKPLIFSTTPYLESEFFEGYTPNSIFEKVQAVLPAKILKAAAAGEAFALVNLSSVTGLPVLAYASRFSVNGHANGRWIVMVMWQYRLMNSLTYDSATMARVLTENGGLITSPDRAELIGESSRAKHPLVKAAIKVKQDFYQLRYKSKDAERVGVFRRLKRYNLLVTLDHDPLASQVSTGVVIKQALLWGWIFVLVAFLVSFFGSDWLTRSLRQLVSATMRIAEGDFSPALDTSKGDEIGLLSRSVGHMAVKIKQLLVKEVADARRTKELETAKLVQETFMPLSRIQRRDLSVAGINKPASETGGDIWGYYDFSETLHLIYIADATGHGVGAALVTAMVHSCCRTAFKLLPPDIDPEKIAERLAMIFSSVLIETTKKAMAMTFQAAVIDTATGRLHVTNAGHPFAMLTVPGAPNVVPKTNSLIVRGSPLGLVEDEVPETRSYDFPLGSRLVLYSDGIIEGKGPGGKMYGKEKMRQIMSANVLEGPGDLARSLIDAAYLYFEGVEPDDDITVVVIAREDEAGSVALPKSA